MIHAEHLHMLPSLSLSPPPVVAAAIAEYRCQQPTGVARQISEKVETLHVVHGRRCRAMPSPCRRHVLSRTRCPCH